MNMPPTSRTTSFVFVLVVARRKERVEGRQSGRDEMEVVNVWLGVFLESGRGVDEVNEEIIIISRLRR
jgi:hypothetical protein